MGLSALLTHEQGTAETVHVVFGISIAGAVRAALKLLGLAERVIGLPDALSIGPIDPPDPFARQDWVARVLRAVPGEDDIDPAAVQRAWAEATAPGIAPVFWMCLRSPPEHACFLAFASRMDGRAFDMIDATDLDFTTRDGVRSPWSLGLLRPEDIVASGLYERRRPVPPDERQAAAARWSVLRRENAPFRIVQEGRLVSAPLTQYDAILLEQAGAEWEVAARLIGRTIGHISSTRVLAGQGTSDVVLFGRLLALGESGLLDLRGAGLGMRDLQVRRS